MLENNNIIKWALLIEDDEACQRVMSIFLQQLDYEVAVADESETALQMIKNIQYDLILTDIRNKGLSGDKIIYLIRRMNESQNAGTPIIVWSAFVNKNNEEKYLDWGADWALTKPCQIDDLKIAIDECSKLQRYKRKFLHRIEMIEQEW